MQRQLGTFSAMMLGLGSILGTGVFVSIGIGASVAGPAVILAIAVAALVAMCNALSSAQLAASHPVSGGTYEYGYQYLHPRLGFTAGWMFLCAKSASAATAALGFAGYLLHTLGQDATLLTPIAAITCIALVAIVLAGLRRSNMVNIVIVSITLVALAAFVLAGLPMAMRSGSANLQPFFDGGANGDASNAGAGSALSSFLHATALMFVAYTGYGRIATMGEEVKQPRRTIPRAIMLTLGVSALLYMAVSIVAVMTAGSAFLSDATQQQAAPLEVIARGFSIPGAPGIALLVAIGAMTAMLGVLLNLILGLSRVVLAMGRRGDFPGATAKLDAGGSPWAAIIVTGVFITALACIGSVKTTWTFSAFTVLIYYALTNMAALKLPREHRLYPRAIAWAGLGSCAFLAFWVPWPVWLAGLGLIALGLLWQAMYNRKAVA